MGLYRGYQYQLLASEDLTGQVFGKLTVQSIEHFRDRQDQKRRYWRCICECGASTLRPYSKLKRAKNPSCGHCPKPVKEIIRPQGGLTRDPRSGTLAALVHLDQLFTKTPFLKHSG